MQSLPHVCPHHGTLQLEVLTLLLFLAGGVSPSRDGCSKRNAAATEYIKKVKQGKMVHNGNSWNLANSLLALPYCKIDVRPLTQTL